MGSSSLWVAQIASKLCPFLINGQIRLFIKANSSSSTAIPLLESERRSRNSEKHLYYCDVGQSQQKGSCEKNHSELRQILEKGLFSFDDLDHKDLQVLMCHANSNPKECLMGHSPIEMFIAYFGTEGEEFLDLFGIRQIERDELCLTPDILDIERIKRGKEPLRKTKR